MENKELKERFIDEKTGIEYVKIILEEQVSKLVNSLKKKGYIDIEIKYKDNSKEIESRKLDGVNGTSDTNKWVLYASNYIFSPEVVEVLSKKAMVDSV